MFIGEQGLNLTHALNAANATGYVYSGSAGGVGADKWTFNSVYNNSYQLYLDQIANPGNFTIGWWASAAQVSSTTPSQTIDLPAVTTSFTVIMTTFVGYTGVWYLVNPSTGMAYISGGSPIPVINVLDPSLTI